MKNFQYTKNDIKNLDRIYRINLINSVTGVKPANLIGTKSKRGKENLAIFSSVIHLGSDPPHIGFMIRPQYSRITDTFKNIKETKFYTINQISKSLYKKAHLTSGKINESEFDKFSISKVYLNNFHAPFAKDSFIKLGMHLIELIELPNRCTLVVGEIEFISLDENLLDNEGRIDFGTNESIGISGCDTYLSLKKIETLEYVSEKFIKNI